MDENRSWAQLSEEERLAYEIVEKVAQALHVPIGTSMREARAVVVELLKQRSEPLR